MRDDGVGLRVAQILKKGSLGRSVLVWPIPGLDLSLVEKLEGASAVVLVDALRAGKQPGSVSKHTITGRDSLPIELPSLHDLRLADLFALADDAGLLTCPVIVIGVEPKDIAPGRRLSPELEAALPGIVHEVTSTLEKARAEGRRRRVVDRRPSG